MDQAPLLQFAQIAIDKDNIANLERFLKLFAAFKEGGDVSQLQVDQVEQHRFVARPHLSEEQGVHDLGRFHELAEHTPIRTYVTNKREPFYRWLYGNNVQLGQPGSVTLRDVPVCRFVGRKAEEANTLSNVALFEPPFEPETIQFYKIRKVSFDSTQGMEFNRELRKVGAGHTLDRRALLLD